MGIIGFNFRIGGDRDVEYRCRIVHRWTGLRLTALSSVAKLLYITACVTCIYE